MYVGLADLLVANAIRRNSWLALAPVAGFVVLIDRLQMEAEDQRCSRMRGRVRTYRPIVAVARPQVLDS